MARILILIGAHLCTAPRPMKEAAALAEAGHDVTVAGVWFDEELAARDEALARRATFALTPAWDFRPRGIGGRIRSALTRYSHRRARDCFAADRTFSPLLLGYAAPRLLARARAERADLTIVHSESGLWAAEKLLDAGARVGVDFEDWFSEDLPSEARTARPVAEIRRLEARLARDCKYALATSNAMAAAMAQEFAAPMPAVVYNVFPRGDAPKRTSPHRRPSLHWYSQTIGRGRGLELLFEALRHMAADAEVHLRGSLRSGDRAWLENAVPAAWRDRVQTHPTVPNDELPACIAEHDIGLALETNAIRSRDLTVTNKMFQYMQAGLAIVATATRGQREAMDAAPDAGVVVPCDDPKALAAALDALVADGARLAACKAASRRAAEDRWCWELQKATIVERAGQALEQSR